MPAVKELLVNALVATPAISRRELGRDYESVMVFPFLSRGGLMALQAVHTFTCMSAHLIFMNYRILRARVTLGAFARSANESRGRLLGFTRGPGPIDQERSQNESKSDYYRDKNRAEGHCHGDSPHVEGPLYRNKMLPRTGGNAAARHGVSVSRLMKLMMQKPKHRNGTHTHCHNH